MTWMVLAMAGLACLPGRRNVQAPGPAGPSATQALETLRAEAHAQWELRGNPESLRKSLSLYESSLDLMPDSQPTLGLLVRGWTLLADLHDSTPQAREEDLLNATRWGHTCLDRYPDAVPCLYWTAQAHLLLGEVRGPAAWLVEVDQSRPWLEDLEERAPEFFYYGADRLQGTLLTRLPSFGGQDLEQARVHFDRAISGAPEFFATRVELARTWAVATGNRAVFDDQVAVVLQSDAGVLPEVEPEQRAMQDRARELRTQADALFTPRLPPPDPED